MPPHLWSAFGRRRLLSDLEAAGRRNAHDIGDYHEPLVARLRALGIESIHAMQAKAGAEGAVTAMAGTYGGWDGMGQPL